ncbi:hypothetical protein AXG93_2139s1250 [Marchantia polymorpha subsp. ruderalis]|uniref:Uncharacterized protein n=1 Tax=Marchantia polymorpha subsp. ruderalis TaxID=1480154 RepID=A0A176WMQ2_MARPO|nr:hypothetical protein AXG93_2139s1250 [Marchantia polymorpha subsp. ruderalis]
MGIGAGGVVTATLRDWYWDWGTAYSSQESGPSQWDPPPPGEGGGGWGKSRRRTSNRRSSWGSSRPRTSGSPVRGAAGWTTQAPEAGNDLLSAPGAGAGAGA